MTNEELGGKFKAILKEYNQSLDANAVGEYLRELDCQFYMHEFVKKAIIYALETVRQTILKLYLQGEDTVKEAI